MGVSTDQVIIGVTVTDKEAFLPFKKLVFDNAINGATVTKIQNNSIFERVRKINQVVVNGGDTGEVEAILCGCEDTEVLWCVSLTITNRRSFSRLRKKLKENAIEGATVKYTTNNFYKMLEQVEQVYLEGAYPMNSVEMALNTHY